MRTRSTTPPGGGNRAPTGRAAACASDRNPDAWFPDDMHTGEARRAKQVCTACPLMAPCAAYALHAGETEGIWGGLDPQQRTRLTIHAKGSG